MPTLNRPVSPSPFPPLTPVLSTFSTRSLRPPPRDDGLDNFPPPLPSSPVALQRRLTEDSDLERQMAVGSNEGDVGPPPEGGRDAWGCIFGAFFILFCVFGFVTSFGQLAIVYLAGPLRDYSKSQVAWISSVQITLTFAGSLPAGRFFDSHGARSLVITGTTLSVASLVAIAFCKQYYQFMLAHAACGLSASILYSPATAVAGHWFMRKRSTAVGIVVCGSGLGGVIYPIALKRLIDELNFRDALLIIAGMNAALMLPSWWLLKARLPPRKPLPLSSLMIPWSDARYACLVIGSTLIMTNWLSPYFNAPVYVSASSLSTPIQSYSIAILQAGSFLGRALSGILADKFGVWNMFVTMGFLSGISVFAFWCPYPVPDAVGVVGLVSYGLASGAWVTLVAASCGAISPTREFGGRLGMLWSLSSLGALAGPVICGVLVTANDQRFTYAGIFCGLTAVVGTGIAIMPRALEIGRNLRILKRGGTGLEHDHEKT